MSNETNATPPGGMPEAFDPDKGPFYMISVEKIMVLPSGQATFESFTGLLNEEQIRAGIGDLVIGVIGNYPPSRHPDVRPATRSEAEDAMLQEISSKATFNDNDNSDDDNQGTKH